MIVAMVPSTWAASPTATRDELVRRGKVQAAKFSWDHTFRSTVAVYEELTGTRLL